MKTWKHADWIIQIILLIAGFIIAFIFDFRAPAIFPCYYVLGGWQILSFLTNMIWRKGQWKIMSRKIYGIAVLIVVAMGFTLYASIDYMDNISVFVIYMIGLLYVTPLLALWYISICYREWQLIRTKEFMHLK